MTNGLLLDSHLLVWFDQNRPVSEEAGFAISDARVRDLLFVSDISLWELGVASLKKSFERRPDLRGLPIELWFEQVCERLNTQACTISKAIAGEAAKVPVLYGSGDPGDCFLIATARVNGLALVTRDAKIIELAARCPEYLAVIA